MFPSWSFQECFRTGTAVRPQAFTAFDGEENRIIRCRLCLPRAGGEDEVNWMAHQELRMTKIGGRVRPNQVKVDRNERWTDEFKVVGDRLCLRCDHLAAKGERFGCECDRIFGAADRLRVEDDHFLTMPDHFW